MGGGASGGGGGLFGASTAGASQPQPSGGSGLFGGLGQSSQPQQGSGGGSLFGNTNTAASQPNQNSASLFGASQPAQAQRQSTFTKSINDVNALVVDRPIGPDETVAQPAYFDSLLEKGRKRQQDEHLTPFGELPQLQLGLADISRKVRKLGQDRGPSAGMTRGGDLRAHYLLSASGVNAGQTLRDLEDLTGTPALSTAPAADLLRANIGGGVKETLAQRYQDDFKKLVDNQRRRVQEDFERMIDEKLHDVDWSSHRQRIYEHFGLRKPENLDATMSDGANNAAFGRSSVRRNKSVRFGVSTNEQSFGMSGLSRSVIGSVGLRGARQSQFVDVAEKLPSEGIRPAPEDRVMRAKQDKYAERVQELNAVRLQERLYPVLHKFADIESEPTNEDTSMLVHAYRALVQIVGEKPGEASGSEPEAVHSRQFARDYLDENERSPGSMATRKRIVNGSRKFLEELFLGQVDAIVGRNPMEANVGGVPTAINKVKGFVRVRAKRKELGPDIDLLQSLNGEFCWVLIYYLIRCGLAHEALSYCEQNAAAFKNIDRFFPAYLRSYVGSSDKRLTPEQQTKINNEYNQRVRLAPEDSIDPYRMMCYKVVGRCDLQRRNFPNNIVGATDHNDWLWLQFCLAREYDRVDELQQNAFDLRDVRKAIREIGDRHFGPGSDVVHAPMLYFFMQILAGQFEKAVADLYPHHYVSAVHFAVALDYYGLLRVSGIENSEDLLSHTTSELPQLAFGSMVGLYTRDFRTANPTAAADYLCLICLDGDLTGEIGRKNRELCHQALTELVLETREFAQLLGDIRGDGRRIRGAIEQRLKLIGLGNERDFLKHITVVAARTAEEQGRTTDASLLFHLAEDYNRVIEVVNQALSLYLTTDLGEAPMRLTPLKPRATDVPRSNGQSQQMEASLSLTAVDDPIELARAMKTLYDHNAMYFNKIQSKNSDATNVLLKLADARRALEMGKWALAVDFIRASQILPTDERGNVSAIRTKVRDFEAMPSVLARAIGHVMLWAVVGCSNQVAVLKSEAFETGERRQAIANCVGVARDVMVFAGMIRFKLPASVMEMIARAGQELGVY
ncbi:NIC-domain-containing protein [Polychaeton citri CBS 116435]|uniref:NIC-domain-containing protein n=1 Tax=Polychaeton citri CBS 116435 TaxID=1314669 RepID=A0A9P4Q5H1_9PEZI|nr:NIC-domain-containing protein [Polychaeton citri CBS 116435]